MRIIANGKGEKPFPYKYWPLKEEALEQVSIQRKDKVYSVSFSERPGVDGREDKEEIFLEVRRMEKNPETGETEMGDVCYRMYIDESKGVAKITKKGE